MKRCRCSATSAGMARAPRTDRAAGPPGKPGGRRARRRPEEGIPGDGPHNPMHSQSPGKSYKPPEQVVDAFEDVANEIDGIVIDHA